MVCAEAAGGEGGASLNFFSLSGWVMYGQGELGSRTAQELLQQGRGRPQTVSEWTGATLRRTNR